MKDSFGISRDVEKVDIDLTEFEEEEKLEEPEYVPVEGEEPVEVEREGEVYEPEYVPVEETDLDSNFNDVGEEEKAENTEL